MTRNDKGITLLILAITVIIIVILAGVSLKLVIGDDATIKKAQNAQIESKDNEWNERAEAIIAGALSNQKNIEGNNTEAVKMENMRLYLYKAFAKASDDSSKVFVDKNKEGYIISDDERIYILKKDFSNAYNVKAFRNLIETTDEWQIQILDDSACAIIGIGANRINNLNGKVVIPGIIRDKTNPNKAYQVVEITGEYTGTQTGVFELRKGITEVDFSNLKINDFKKIGARTFKDCTNLKITLPNDIPNTITYIGDNAFENCELLDGNINIINQTINAKYGKGVFKNCKKLTRRYSSII